MNSMNNNFISLTTQLYNTCLDRRRRRKKIKIKHIVIYETNSFKLKTGCYEKFQFIYYVNIIFVINKN